MATAEGSSVIVIFPIPETAARHMSMTTLALVCGGEFSRDSDADYWPGL